MSSSTLFETENGRWHFEATTGSASVDVDHGEYEASVPCSFDDNHKNDLRKSNMDVKGVKFARPNGEPMLLTSSLVTHLAGNRGAIAKFAIGDWLVTLSGPELQSLLDLADAHFSEEVSGSGAAPVDTDDLVGVALYGSEAERNRSLMQSESAMRSVLASIPSRRIEDVQELVGRVAYAVSMEANRRQGFIDVKGKLRMYPFPNDSAVVTDKGVEFGALAKKRFH